MTVVSLKVTSPKKAHVSWPTSSAAVLCVLAGAGGYCVTLVPQLGANALSSSVKGCYYRHHSGSRFHDYCLPAAGLCIGHRLGFYIVIEAVVLGLLKVNLSLLVSQVSSCPLVWPWSPMSLSLNVFKKNCAMARRSRLRSMQALSVRSRDFGLQRNDLDRCCGSLLLWQRYDRGFATPLVWALSFRCLRL